MTRYGRSTTDPAFPAAPPVSLLDEPYQGFDWETYLRFWDVAARLRERGRCVLVVSHPAWDAGRLDVVHRLKDAVAATWNAEEHTAVTQGASR